MGAICSSETSLSGKNTIEVKQESETLGINVDSRYVDASDTIHDYLCTVCERKGKNSEAIAFCKSCTKYYCMPCSAAHDIFQDDHDVYGTDRMDEWKRHRQGNVTYELSSDGKEKLSTLETGCGHGLNHPCAVAFYSTTSQLLVAQKDSDDLVVFKLK
ncbi:hypothetical protein MAR_024248 [Mya arenaria]|uniref:B box-type domain-containing protein n=1 Tax=Mya arenaria TaxID=6604 RepID=A0ABY7DY82_MYAAR|nr:hypothetical protein MAR_024248 [Mya arenaria]